MNRWDYGYEPYRDDAADARLAALRRKANDNLAELERNKHKLKPEPPKRETELDRATAEEIADGHAVKEFRELRKLENRFARRKNLTDDEKAHWEEVDARLDTLRDQLCLYNRDELSRLVRIANKANKRGILQRG